MKIEYLIYPAFIARFSSFADGTPVVRRLGAHGYELSVASVGRRIVCSTADGVEDPRVYPNLSTAVGVFSKRGFTRIVVNFGAAS